MWGVGCGADGKSGAMGQEGGARQDEVAQGRPGLCVGPGVQLRACCCHAGRLPGRGTFWQVAGGLIDWQRLKQTSTYLQKTPAVQRSWNCDTPVSPLTCLLPCLPWPSPAPAALLLLPCAAL